MQITAPDICSTSPPPFFNNLHPHLKLWRDLLTLIVSARLAKEVERQTESERLPECISLATAGSGKPAQGVLKRQFGALLRSPNAEMADDRYSLLHYASYYSLLLEQEELCTDFANMQLLKSVIHLAIWQANLFLHWILQPTSFHHFFWAKLCVPRLRYTTNSPQHTRTPLETVEQSLAEVHRFLVFSIAMWDSSVVPRSALSSPEQENRTDRCLMCLVQPTFQKLCTKAFAELCPVLISQRDF